jgi:HPr kinase/phosphorylase
MKKNGDIDPSVKGSVEFLTIGRMYELLKDRLKLKLLTPDIPLGRKIRSAEIHRPGLAFSGYYDYFAFDRVQILGKTEASFLHKLSPALKKRNLKRFFSYKIPCIVVAKNQRIPDDFLALANEHKVPVFKSILQTSKLVSQITVFIEDENAPRVSMHGTLVDVYGTGILLLGKSGIGKSECALELVERGHRLVADDVVYIKRYSNDELLGASNEAILHHMEIRGLGIINVRSIFGVGAIRNQKRINMVVTLEKWGHKDEYERTGLDIKQYEILGQQVPHLILPVRPGRNIPVIVEIAALNDRLKRMGYHSARDLNRKLIENMNESVLETDIEAAMA